MSQIGPKNPRLAYKVWDLHKSTYFNMSKQEQRQLKILVRNREDGSLVSAQINVTVSNLVLKLFF